MTGIDWEICTTYYYIISNHNYSLILLGGDHRNRGHPGNNTTPEDPSNPDEMVSSNDRLLQLIIKGILYESCVDFCQQKATGAKHADHIKFTNLLSQSDFRLGSSVYISGMLVWLPTDHSVCRSDLNTQWDLLIWRRLFQFKTW